MKVICRNCGRVSEPERILKGHVLITLILLCFYIIPGIIYMIWRRTGLKDACAICKSNNVVPENSPEGRRLSVDSIDEDTHVKCPDCRELVLKDARKCKHCGTALVPQ